MSEPSKPVWRQVFDAWEGSVAPHINDLARNEDVATLIALQHRANDELGRRLQRASSRVLHLFNLPAGTDVTRLLRQIGHLEHEVRDLKNQLADATAAQESAAVVPAPEAEPTEPSTVKKATVDKPAKKSSAKKSTAKKKTAKKSSAKRTAKRTAKKSSAKKTSSS